MSKVIVFHKWKRGTSLVLVIFLSTFLLAGINYFTIKTISAVRAYVNGESQYSKGQKDGARHLIIYLSLQDEQYFNSFKEEIQVPIGDSLARVGLMRNDSYETIYSGFLQGKNHEDDIDNMIWLFKNFKEIAFMKEAITIWKEADVLIGRLKNIGDSIHTKVEMNDLSIDKKAEVIKNINLITNELTIKERAFSNLLGVTARNINVYLFLANGFIIVLIITTVVAYSNRGVRQLRQAKRDLEQTNKDLNTTNQELDNFIYAASHDLKSPINNLEGLISLVKYKENDQDLRTIFEKMEYSISTLKKTIAGLTEVMKMDKNPLDDIQKNNVNVILEEFVEANQHLIQDSRTVITTSIEVETITFSAIGLASIVHNLISNAIKYASPERDCFISIKTYRKQKAIVLEIQDNGLGIDLNRNKHKLFRLFSRFHNHVEGSGLGLYIIKKIVDKHNGTIDVESTPGQGTTFFVTLPGDETL